MYIKYTNIEFRLLEWTSDNDTNFFYQVFSNLGIQFKWPLERCQNWPEVMIWPNIVEFYYTMLEHPKLGSIPKFLSCPVGCHGDPTCFWIYYFDRGTINEWITQISDGIRFIERCLNNCLLTFHDAQRSVTVWKQELTLSSPVIQSPCQGS